MSVLRNQLQAAAAEYKAVKYPGDLAWIMQGGRKDGESWRLSPARVAAAVLALAASVALAFIPANGPKTRLQFRLNEAMLPMQPPPGMVSAVEDPLLDCGAMFVKIGKDLAHHADALMQTM